MYSKSLIVFCLSAVVFCSALPAPVADPKPSHAATIYSPGSYSYQSQYVEHSPAVVKTVVSEPLVHHVVQTVPVFKAYPAPPPTIVKYEAAPLFKTVEYPIVHPIPHAVVYAH